MALIGWAPKAGMLAAAATDARSREPQGGHATLWEKTEPVQRQRYRSLRVPWRGG
jgi:hypothetical protein